MKIFILSLAILATGCSTTTYRAPDFPAASELMTTPCPDLELIEPSNSRASDGAKVIASNYQKYKQCQNQVNSWIYWYTEEKKNFVIKD